MTKRILKGYRLVPEAINATETQMRRGFEALSDRKGARKIYDEMLSATPTEAETAVAEFLNAAGQLPIGSTEEGCVVCVQLDHWENFISKLYDMLDCSSHQARRAGEPR